MQHYVAASGSVEVAGILSCWDRSEKIIFLPEISDRGPLSPAESNHFDVTMVLLFIQKMLRMLVVVSREATAALSRRCQTAKREYHEQKGRETAIACPSMSAATISRVWPSFIFLLPCAFHSRLPATAAPPHVVRFLYAQRDDGGILRSKTTNHDCIRDAATHFLISLSLNFGYTAGHKFFAPFWWARFWSDFG